MPSSTTTSDTTNPLLLIKQAEEREEARVQALKKEQEEKERKEIDRLTAEEKEDEATARNEANASLRAFAQEEPPAIMQKGKDAAKKDIDALKSKAESRKKVIEETLLQELLSSSYKA